MTDVNALELKPVKQKLHSGDIELASNKTQLHKIR